MRYEIRDISPPAGVRSAMELQVCSLPLSTMQTDHSTCIAFVAAECSFEKCHFVYVRQAPQDSMMPFFSSPGVRSCCVCAKQPYQHSVAMISALLGTHCSAGSTEAAL